MSERKDCVKCGTSIMAATFDRNDGLCFPCLRGSFNCELCGKVVLITKGVNDQDKICLGCFQEVGSIAVKEELVTINEPDEFMEQDTACIYFRLGITDDRFALYKQRIELLIKDHGELVRHKHTEKIYTSYTIGNLKSPEKIRRLLETNLPKLISEDKYQVDYLYFASTKKRQRIKKILLLIAVILLMAVIAFAVFKR